MICKVKLLLEIRATMFLRDYYGKLAVSDGKQLVWVRHLLISKNLLQ